MTMTTAADLVVTTLGPCRLDSPLKSQLESRQTTVHDVGETDRVLFHDTVNLIRESGCDLDSLPSFEPAGPRQKIFFDTAKMRVGIVTCGGLCPGINNVIRGIVMELSFHYGVQRIYGFRNGYQGFVGAMKIVAVVAKRDGKIAVVGIPKTIDNDIPSIDLRRSDEVDPVSPRGGESVAEWRGPCEADGPPLWLHRLLCLARRAGCQLRPHSGGALRA